jgi:HK97 family phage portal protein
MVLSALRNYLAPTIVEAPKGMDANLLNRMLYGQFTASTMVVWYDSNQQTFIDKGYKGNALVYSIIRKIAEKGKQCPTFVYKETEASKKFKGGKYSAKELNRLQSVTFRKKELVDVSYSDPVNMLIKNPNPNQTWSEFLDSMLTWYNTSGEIFIYGFSPSDGLNKGKIKEMYVMPSNYVELVAGNLFQPVKGYKLIIGDQNIEIPADQVLHIKNTNLTWDLNGAQLRGMPPLLAGLKTLQANNESTEAKQKTFQNGGAKGIISPNVNNPEFWPSPDQRAKMDERIDERINGTQNINKIVASSIPLRYDAIGLSPVAMDIINSQNSDLQTLCGLWGVNPVLFSSNATYANLEHAQKSLVTDVIMPQLQLIEEKFTEWLGESYGMDYVIDFDISSFSELQPDVQVILDTYGKSPYFTGNEVRSLLNWHASEDPAMDVHWIPTNVIPSDEALGNAATDFVDFQA